MIGLSYVTAVDCIPHCSDKNVCLFSTSSVAGDRAHDNFQKQGVIKFIFSSTSTNRLQWHKTVCT